MKQLAVVVLAASSCRELSIPPAQVGRVSGFVVRADALGREVPVVGAQVAVVGSSTATVSSAQGAFSLSPITSAAGSLVLSADLDGDGTVDLARALDFADWGIAPGRDNALGKVALSAPGIITGVAQLVDAPLASAGVEVFVPGTALVTSTGDTGAFALRGVPQGKVTLAFTHPGYQPLQVGPVTVGNAEVLELAPVTLALAQAGTASLRGQLQLDPAGDLASAHAVVGGASLTVATDGTFSGTVGPGRVTVVAGASGYSDVVVPNVLLAPGDQLDLGVLVLRAGAGRYDAGSLVTDAGLPPHCGNGQVDQGEECDDGNHLDGDGCSARCALEVQWVTGQDCLTTSSITLVPIDATRRGARIAGDGGTPAAVSFSSCLGNVSTVARVVLPWKGTLSVTGPQRYVSLLTDRCGVEFQCAPAAYVSAPLPPGPYMVGLVPLPAVTTLIATPAGPGDTCGDGVVDPGETCDDGNFIASDGCNELCQLPAQVPSVFCAAAPTLLLGAVGPKTWRARVDAPATSRVDPTAPLSCFTSPASQSASLLPLRAGQTVQVLASEVNDVALSLREHCGAPDVMCKNATTNGPELLTFTSPDGGLYVLTVASSGALGAVTQVTVTGP